MNFLFYLLFNKFFLLFNDNNEYDIVLSIEKSRRRICKTEHLAPNTYIISLLFGLRNTLWQSIFCPLWGQKESLAIFWLQQQSYVIIKYNKERKMSRLQLLNHRDIIPTSNIVKNETPNFCKGCGGCCKSQPGGYSPDQFSNKQS